MKEMRYYWILCVVLFLVRVCDECMEKYTASSSDTNKSEPAKDFKSPPPPPSQFYPTIPNKPVRRVYREPTPDDAYNEGYCMGEEQGRYDGSNGYGHGYGYDDSGDYYDYYETAYQEGYQNGYDSGYDEGQSEYEDGEDEED